MAREIGREMDGYKVVVTKSTVPVGTSYRVRELIGEELRRAGKEIRFSVASNPEFLREGAAIGDFMRPDRVVIGADDDAALGIMKDLYRPLFLNETPFVLTGIPTAELTKYAANAFLATKISFINEFANLCEKVGADVQALARGIGLDGRIGRKFLHAGPGFGGSCFPKDTRSAAHFAREAGESARDRRGGDPRERRASAAAWSTRSSAPSTARRAARPSRCSGSPSSPRPTTCATRRPSRSSRASRSAAPTCAPTTRWRCRTPAA